ncbi:MAG TPA: hypothetical protein VKD91_24140 [Pyrinomonadaceae bacterium]|nr:hypothetical protein [Pyrinomonadaceae bacterium]
MVHHRVRRPRLFLLSFLLLIICFSATAVTNGQTQRGPSDVVRDFYKAMREHRFKDAWALTIYKSAVDDLTAEELEDLRPDFELKASQVPDQIEITGEQIQGNIATVFVKVPVTESTPQITSEPVNLISASGNWIIGTEADQAEVKKKGRRFFLDALIEEHQSDIEDLLKRLLAVQLVYSQEHKGQLGDLQALIAASLIAKESGDPKAIGYNVRIAINPDGKGYIATAEPTRYGHTGKLSFWMDQTGNIKKADNGGKPISGSR